MKEDSASERENGRTYVTGRDPCRVVKPKLDDCNKPY
eukprot:COSAG02_NODE_60203_length_272_cov_0.583815_1_plen_36_part_01